MHTLYQLISDIWSLRVKQGDTLLVHSSYKSIGKMEKGAETIVKALQTSVGYGGLLLMPSFNMIPEGPSKRRSETWDIKNSKSTVGWITEYFRQLPDVKRSDHYSHSIAAWGKDSSSFISGHRSNEGPISHWDRNPWGKTYGTRSPFHRAYQRDGKIMMIGGIPWSTCTHIHFIETLYWNFLLESGKDLDFSDSSKVNPDKLGGYWDHRFCKGYLNDFMCVGHIGDAECKVFYIRKFVDFLLEELKRNPEKFLKYSTRSS